MKIRNIFCKICYLILCFLLSCLIIFSIHKGFKRQDIIIIPIFAILLFLLMNFSINLMNKNTKENFLKYHI